MKYLSATFSLDMFEGNIDFNLIRMKQINIQDIPADVECHIASPGMRSMVEKCRGIMLIYKPSRICLENEDDVLYFINYKGPHLRVGMEALPEGARISVLEITQRPNGCRKCNRGPKCMFCNIIKWMQGK